MDGLFTKQAVLLPRPSNFLLHLPKPYSLTKLEQEQSVGKYDVQYIEFQFFIHIMIFSVLLKLLTTYRITLTYSLLTISSILIGRAIASSITFRIIASTAIQTSETKHFANYEYEFITIYLDITPPGLLIKRYFCLKYLCIYL